MLAILNTLVAHALVSGRSAVRPRSFFGAVLGGMVGRMAVMLAAVIAGVLLLGLPRLPLVVSLLAYFDSVSRHGAHGAAPAHPTHGRDAMSALLLALLLQAAPAQPAEPPAASRRQPAGGRNGVPSPAAEGTPEAARARGPAAEIMDHARRLSPSPPGCQPWLGFSSKHLAFL